MYGAPRRHRGRLPIVVLLIVSLAIAAYLLVGRHSGSGSTNSTGFVATSQNFVAAGLKVTDAAQQVQRFLELQTFDTQARRYIGEMGAYVAQLETIARQSSGAQRQLANTQVSAGKQAIDAANQFRAAVAFSYRLSSANTAQHLLAAALAEFEHNIKAWNQA